MRLKHREDESQQRLSYQLRLAEGFLVKEDIIEKHSADETTSIRIAHH
jgi:hypothetical protein